MLASSVCFGADQPSVMQTVKVSADRRGFLLEPSGRAFSPLGFNYDHDQQVRLLEEYWNADWEKVEQDFAEMKEMGANVVRIHLQLGKFMDGPKEPNSKSPDRLSNLLRLAEKHRLYLDLTGLGCYRKADVPAWYDKLSEADRWGVQAQFWRAVAGRCNESPAVFCYDLMNEPVVPGGRRENGDWLGPPFVGMSYVQFISLDQADRPRATIARQWIRELTQAIRQVDRHHLITVGLVDWSLDRPGITSGFVPREVAGELDFISVHIYPEKGKVDEALKTLAGFSVGKPVVIEETAPLKCSIRELDEFMDQSKTNAAGWIGFYWGKTPKELRGSRRPEDALLLQWLELFERKVKDQTHRANN